MSRLRLQVLILMLTTYLTKLHGSPLPQYNPNLYYGPSVREPYDLPMQYWFPRPSARMAPVDINFSARQLYGRPTVEVEELPFARNPFHSDDYSPELLRLLNAFLMLKEFENSRGYATGSIGGRDGVQQQKIGFVDKEQPHPPQHPVQRQRTNFIESEKEQLKQDTTDDPEEELETNKSDRKDDGDEEIVASEDTSSNRRTFGLIIPAVEMGIKMIDQDLGLGLSSETSFETSGKSSSSSRVKQTQMEINALREAREKAEMEQTKTQATLQALRAESEMVSRSNQAEMESIKSALEKMSEQTERERREKEELQARLENEARLRQSDNLELKRRLETEAELREREKLRMQSELVREASLREKEKMEYQNKMELEALRIKKANEEYKTTMDGKFSTQHIIYDYRSPVFGTPQFPPVISKELTVGFI